MNDWHKKYLTNTNLLGTPTKIGSSRGMSSQNSNLGPVILQTPQFDTTYQKRLPYLNLNANFVIFCHDCKWLALNNVVKEGPFGVKFGKLINNIKISLLLTLLIIKNTGITSSDIIQEIWFTIILTKPQMFTLRMSVQIWNPTKTNKMFSLRSIQ